MAVTEPMLFAVEGARQASQLGALAGKTYVVGQVSSAGNGLLGNWLFLQPVGDMGAAAAKKTVAIKLEGARQAASLAGLTGKTVTVAKAPVTVGGACHWLALHPVSGVAGSVAAAGAGGAAQGSTAGLVMVKLEGGRQAAQLAGMSGKCFSVVQSPTLGGKGAGWLILQPAEGGGKLIALNVQANAGSAASTSLAGKSFCLGKVPVVTNGGTWVVFKPVAAGSTVVKGGAVAAAATSTGKIATAQTVALTQTTAGNGATTGLAKVATPAAAVGKTGSAAVVGKAAVAKVAGNGVIWKGTGMGLGLGLGLGAWGPAILLGAAVTGVGVYSYLKRRNAGEGDELSEAIA